MNGMITDIQRFSLHDGPGIRSTVFLKGCNLRCDWCHNPETLSGGRELLFHPESCINCLACVGACPTGANRAVDGGHVLDRSLCDGCLACAEVCCAGALAAAGRSVGVDEVMAEVLQDEVYYRTSGGGVTVSGGEAFRQPEFLSALVDACAAKKIPVAVETNLIVPFATIAPFLNRLDCLMFDIKTLDADAHRKHTGADNANVLANLAALRDADIRKIARTPVVPGVNDSAGAIAAIARALSGLRNLSYYELLNYNPLGHGKYAALGMDAAATSARRPLPAAALRALRDAAAECGVEVRVS